MSSDTKLGADAEFPDCPSCATNLLVAKATDHTNDWQCFGCNDRYTDVEMDHDGQREQSVETCKNKGEA